MLKTSSKYITDTLKEVAFVEVSIDVTIGRVSGIENLSFEVDTDIERNRNC